MVVKGVCVDRERSPFSISIGYCAAVSWRRKHLPRFQMSILVSITESGTYFGVMLCTIGISSAVAIAKNLVAILSSTNRGGQKLLRRRQWKRPHLLYIKDYMVSVSSELRTVLVRRYICGVKKIILAISQAVGNRATTAVRPAKDGAFQ